MSKLEIIATLLQKGHITLQEFIELTKEPIPLKEYIYLPAPRYYNYQPGWTYRPWTQPYYYTDNLPINICNGTNTTDTTTITYDSAFKGSINSCVN